MRCRVQTDGQKDRPTKSHSDLPIDTRTCSQDYGPVHVKCFIGLESPSLTDGLTDPHIMMRVRI